MNISTQNPYKKVVSYKTQVLTNNYLEKASEIEIKNYNQVLDTFSLHQFVIRKGRTLTETEEFISYKRTY
jgi:hypothetical protein